MAKLINNVLVSSTSFSK